MTIIAADIVNPKSRQNGEIRVFYAYPSKPASTVDAANTMSIDLSRTHMVTLVKWEDLSVNGRLIPSEIFKAIDASQVVIADITALNPNVLYELGYAIGKGKRVWLTADTSRTSRDTLSSNVPALATTGVFAYENGHQMAAAFEKDYLDLIASDPLLDQLRRSAEKTDASVGGTILYMKSLYDTDASVRVAERLSNSEVARVVDDPAETNARALSWYIERLVNSSGVLVHFTASDRSGAEQVNARYALISGLAKAIGANCLLLQEKATSPVPLDFREDVRLYAYGREARGIANEWLLKIENDHRQLAAKIDEDRTRAAQRATLQVLHRGMGDFVAENDVQLISEYFIETAPYLDALAGSTQTIFVGRKGTGKTANLLKLSAELRSANNVVCVVKPAGYDVTALVNAVQHLTGESAREATLVALWKYLLFTEIVAELGREYERKMNARFPVTEVAGRLWDHADKLGWIETTFAERLERASSSDDDLASMVAKVYRNEVNPILNLLTDVLSEKARVCILIDNVDKAWSRDSDFPILSRFLLSLLVASGEIQTFLARRVARRVDLSTMVFIRSDIYEHVKRVAREPDKLPASSMKWNDDELLLRVVDERFRAASQMPAEETWRRFFPEKIKDMVPRDYVVSRILPRPRDVILLVKAAIGWAVNRAHPVVTEQDFEKAEQEYSAYAIDSVKVENLPVASEFDNIMLQFMYGDVVIDAGTLKTKLDAAGIEECRMEDAIEMLVASSVLGREVDDERFEFVDDLPTARSVALRARHFGNRRRIGSRFKIHVAFHRFLELKT